MLRKPTQIFLITVLILSFFSCQSGNQNNALDAEQKNDSITFWLSRKNSKTTIAYRQQLNKAFRVSLDSENDSLKTVNLSKVSVAFLNLGDSIGFRRVNRITMQLAKKTKDSTTQAESHWDMATLYKRYAVTDSAYYHYSEAQKIFESQGNEYFAGRMFYNMGIMQETVNDYTGAEITTIKAIELLKPLDKYRQLYSCYNNLGSITLGLKEYNRALEYYNEASEYLKKWKLDNIAQNRLQNNIGVTYQEQEQYIKAIPYFKAIIETDSLVLLDPKLYAKALNNYAYSRFKAQKNKDVEKQFKQALHIRDSIKDIEGLSISHYNLADYYITQNDTVRALQEAKQSKLYAEQSSNNERLLETLRFLGRIDPENATDYTQQYISLNDELQEKERQIRNKFSRIRFESDELRGQNQILTNAKQIWSGIALASLITAIFGYIVIDQRRRNQKLIFQEQQQVANQEIFNLMLSQNKKLEEGKKMEQKRISEELHDGVLGKMLGARMVLTGLNKKADEDAITERKKAILTLKDVEGEVRTISHELSHAAYRDIPNFISSIQGLLESTEKSTEIITKLQHDEQVEWDSLSGDIKINLYRLVQESVQNAVKHAQCKNIVINFALKDENLIAIVKDDGKGFDMNKKKKGIGLRHIKSRIDKLKGTWSMDSEIGKGTTLNLSIPVSYN